MGNLGESLAKRIKQLGIERQVEAAGLVEAATAEISNYLAKEDFEVISFKEGILKVVTTSSSAASELNLNSYQVIKNLVNKGQIKRILAVQIDKWKS